MPIYALGDVEPQIHPDAYVHPDAVIIGDVRLGAQASVWPCAVLRGDHGFIEVGGRTSVQDGTVVHTTEEWPTIIGSECVVGHNAHLEGCNVGDRCLIGSALADVTRGEERLLDRGSGRTRPACGTMDDEGSRRSGTRTSDQARQQHGHEDRDGRLGQHPPPPPASPRDGPGGALAQQRSHDAASQMITCGRPVTGSARERALARRRRQCALARAGRPGRPRQGQQPRREHPANKPRAAARGRPWSGGGLGAA